MSGTQRSATTSPETSRHARRTGTVPQAALFARGSGRRNAFFAVCAGLAGLWALFQNFYRIGSAPILADEPTYVDAGWRYLHGLVHTPTTSGGTLVAAPGNFEHPPLAKYLFGLAQVLDGRQSDLTASRCVSALATVLAGVVVAVWIGRAANRWVGLLAGSLVTLLPETAGGSDGRFGRFAMLDNVAELFMVLSVVLAWEWARRTGRAAWIWAVATGAAIGLAAGGKENGFLGGVGPVLLVVVLAGLSRDRAALLRRAGQAGAAVAVSVLVFAALYLPLGNPVSGIKYLVDFQSAQSSAGHLVGFAGRVAMLPPWWTNLWFAGHSYGSVLTVSLVVSALCALVLRRDRLTAWCAAALAVPFVFHCFIANVVLGYYWAMWTPMFLTLAALGAAEVVMRAKSMSGGPVAKALLAGVSGVALLAAPAVETVAQSVTVSQIKPTGAQVLPSLRHAYHLSGSIISTGVGSWAYSYYLPQTAVSTSGSDPARDASLIVVAQVQCRDALDPTVRALAAVNLAQGHAKEIYSDADITVYEVTSPLTAPTAAEIAAVPVSRQTDGC